MKKRRPGDVRRATEGGSTLDPRPDREPGAEPGAIDISALSEDERATLSLVLRGRDIPHQFDGHVLRVAAGRRGAVEEALGWLDGRADVRGTSAAADPGPDRGPVLASRSQRILASLIDGVLFAPAAVVLRHTDAAVVMFVLLTAARVLYEIVFTALWGTTLGKRLLHAEVVDAVTGERPSWRTSTVRAVVLHVTEFPRAFGLAKAVRLVLAIASIAVVIPIAWDPRRQGLHDRAAGTLVLDTRPVTG